MPHCNVYTGRTVLLTNFYCRFFLKVCSWPDIGSKTIHCNSILKKTFLWLHMPCGTLSIFYFEPLGVNWKSKQQKFVRQQKFVQGTISNKTQQSVSHSHDFYDVTDVVNVPQHTTSGGCERNISEFYPAKYVPVICSSCWVYKNIVSTHTTQ